MIGAFAASETWAGLGGDRSTAYEDGNAVLRIGGRLAAVRLAGGELRVDDEVDRRTPFDRRITSALGSIGLRPAVPHERAPPPGLADKTGDDAATPIFAC